MRRALTELLASEGYKVTAAADGGEALETLRAGLRPAVILLDLMMPNCDGWDFRRAQLEDPTPGPVPVVLVTAADSAPIRCAASSVRSSSARSRSNPRSCCRRWNGSPARR